MANPNTLFDEVVFVALQVRLDLLRVAGNPATRLLHPFLIHHSVRVVRSNPADALDGKLVARYIGGLSQRLDGKFQSFDAEGRRVQADVEQPFYLGPAWRRWTSVL